MNLRRRLRVKRPQQTDPAPTHAVMRSVNQPNTAAHVPHRDVLQMQRTHGNAYVRRTLQNRIQASPEKQPNRLAELGTMGWLASGLLHLTGLGPIVEVMEQQGVFGETEAPPPTVIDFSDEALEIVAQKPSQAPQNTQTPIPTAETGETTSPTRTEIPASAAVTVDAIQQKVDALLALKPKVAQEEKASDRKDIVARIADLRKDIAALNAAELGISADELKALKATFYLKMNKATPNYFQMNNLDILWRPDGDGRKGAPGRTCNVTALSISMESMGITVADFNGDKELLKHIWKYSQEMMNTNLKTDEDAAVEALKKKAKKDEDTSEKEAETRAKFETSRATIDKMELDSLRLPDFMQLVVMYNVALKGHDGQKERDKYVTGKQKGLGLDLDTLRSQATAQPDQFKATMDQAQALARESILFSSQFPDFAGYFGVKAHAKNISFAKQLDKIGEFGRYRWKVHELEAQRDKAAEDVEGAEGKKKASYEGKLKSAEKRLADQRKKIAWTITEQEQQLAALRTKAAKAEGDEKAKLDGEITTLEALIQKRKDDNATALEKKETELAALQAQLEAAEGKPKTKASLEKKIAAKQAQIDEAKSPSGIQSEDEYEGMVPLEDYKTEVTNTFVPILSEGKHVEVNLHNHFVHLVEINSDGPVVDEVGEGGGKRLQLSWEKARALGYFQANTVYSRD